MDSDDLAERVGAAGRAGRSGPPRAVPLRGRPAGAGQPGSGIGGRRRRAAHGEVPSRQARRAGPARRRVPTTVRSARTGRRATDKVVSAVGAPGLGHAARPPLRARRRSCWPARSTSRPARAHRWSRRSRRSPPRGGRASPGSSASRAGTRAGRAAAPGRHPRHAVGPGLRAPQEGDTLTLANCPFDALARSHTELVCGMNLALLDGLAGGTGVDNLRARLDPAPGRCCVVLDTAAG